MKNILTSLYKQGIVFKVLVLIPLYYISFHISGNVQAPHVKTCLSSKVCNTQSLVKANIKKSVKKETDYQRINANIHYTSRFDGKHYMINAHFNQSKYPRFKSINSLMSRIQDDLRKYGGIKGKDLISYKYNINYKLYEVK